VALVVLLLGACDRAPSASAPEATLRFEAADGKVRTLDLRALEDASSPREVRTVDPYYGGPKRFSALPLAAVLEAGFDAPARVLEQSSFVLRARDGFAVPIEGSRLLEGDGFLAIDDLDVPGFAPIGPEQVSPAPFYLIWSGDDRIDLATHPRPWQLESIALVDFDRAYPHVLPRGEPPGSAAWRGLALFRARCLECHAINREGGRVGPDLNVPRSIVEYRPEEQIRAYVRDPRSFRYGRMPAHPDLGEDDLDALMAYLRAMAQRKYDPEGTQ